MRTRRTFAGMSISNRLPARFTLAHGLMILAGLMTFVFVNSALRDKRETAPVAVATAQAEAGRTMRPDVVMVPADTPGLEFFAAPEDLVDRVLSRPIDEGQPIMKADLVVEGSLDYRTFAIPVDAYQIEGLRLSRYDRVDVVGFDEDDNPLYLATDLVVDSTSSSASEGLGAIRETYITVQVDDAQALRLSKGQLNGPLHIVRSTGSSPVTAIGIDPPAESADDETAEGQRP